jgi:peptide/nickel transport system permease protein
VAFIGDLAERLHADGRTLTVSVPPVYDDGQTDASGYWVYDYRAITPLVDRIRVLAYDYSTADPGPIAPLPWVQQIVDGTVKASGDPSKLVLGLPLYGYNWVLSTAGTCPAKAEGRTTVSARAAPDLAKRRGATPVYDPTIGEWSFTYQLPVSDVVGDRLWLTVVVSSVTIVFTWLIAFPIGIYSATHQYSWGDYGLTFLGLIGLAIPNFMMALILMYFANIWFGISIGHLMDQKYMAEPMSWDKAKSILAHLWIPVIIVGTGGTASMIRRLRANLLDELRKQYVTTARAKGMHPLKSLIKYPLRMALNFFISDIGSILPAIISGAEITAIVLSLETTGPMLIQALQSQDMYLAGSFLMFLAFLTVTGVLISDLALAVLDPRIRLQGRSTK